MNKTVIGVREWVSFPEWGLIGVRAKADTGARTSVIDVENVIELPGNRVQFEIPWYRSSQSRQPFVAEICRRSHVKSSTGYGSDRLFVRTTIEIGNVCKQAEFSLVGRPGLIHRVLLGREVLRHDFLVDPSAKNLLSTPPRSRKEDL